jgi:geranylgeranyl transferase type-2 subunit alpha
VYRKLVDDVSQSMLAGNLTPATLALTEQLLLKNPEYYTIWNHRRKLFSHLLSQNPDPHQAIKDELRFLFPLLKQFPKCYWIWNYRMWALDLASGELPREQALGTWRDEVGLVGLLLLRDERNFHGWDYRRHVVANLDRLQGPVTPSLVESEFENTTRMVRKALANFSALHYRSKLIPRLLEERRATPEQRREFFDRELDMMQDALIDPFNQSAWFYHQFLMSALYPNCPKSDLILVDVDESERAHYFGQEVFRIKDMLEDFDDCKWIYQALVQYCADFQALSGSYPDSTSKEDMQLWLSALQKLDPPRQGRWADVKKRLGL